MTLCPPPDHFLSFIYDAFSGYIIGYLGETGRLGGAIVTGFSFGFVLALSISSASPY